MIQAGIIAHKEAKRLLAEAKQEVEKLIEGN
jgi:exonuclease VII small subunit